MDISQENLKRLKKKRKANVKRYEKYRSNGRERKHKRGLTNVSVDLSKNIDWYEKEITKGKKVILYCDERII